MRARAAGCHGTWRMLGRPAVASPTGVGSNLIVLLSYCCIQQPKKAGCSVQRSAGPSEGRLKVITHATRTPGRISGLQMLMRVRGAIIAVQHVAVSDSERRRRRAGLMRRRRIGRTAARRSCRDARRRSGDPKFPTHAIARAPLAAPRESRRCPRPWRLGLAPQSARPRGHGATAHGAHRASLSSLVQLGCDREI